VTTRQAFAHDAAVLMAADGDERAPGGAVTVELCGGWDHAPPCPLAPHHTHAERYGGEVRLRVLFATEVERETEVRARIRRALERGAGVDPDGGETTWTHLSDGPSEVTEDERDHAARLAGG